MNKKSNNYFRKVCSLFFSLIICTSLSAQHIDLTFQADSLSEKEQIKVKEIFQEQIKFYSRFGLPDTIRVTLHVFNDRAEGETHIKTTGIKIIRRATGWYKATPHSTDIYLIGRNELKQKDCFKIIKHELSHVFNCLITNFRIPTWINEGLAEYLEHSVVKKGELKHAMTKYEEGRIRTMFMLNEIELDSFVDGTKDEFITQQITDENYSYILAHALITFCMEKAPKDFFPQLISALKNKENSTNIKELIQSLYPGGFTQFKKDFATNYQ
jgi:hypothetical protein